MCGEWQVAGSFALNFNKSPKAQGIRHKLERILTQLLPRSLVV